MRILHCADMQLGYRQYGFQQREIDFYTAAVETLHRAIDLEVDAVIIAGDIFEMPRPPGAAVRILQDAVSELVKHGIQVLGVDGNHDAVDGNWMAVAGIQGLHHSIVEIKGIRIAGLNGLRPATFKSELQRLLDNPSAGRIDVLTIHQSIAEMADFVAQEISAIELAPMLHAAGVRYVAMGDIHDYKELDVGGVRFAYSGSTEINAADEREDKSFSIIDITEDDLKIEMHPIRVRQFIQTYLETDADLDQLLTQIQAANEPMAFVWYDPAVPDLKRRAEAVLDGRVPMYKVLPRKSKDTIKLVEKLRRDGVERKGALLNLKDSVEVYFEPETDEYQLVFQLLETPNSVPEVVQQYLKSKGLEI